MRAVGLALAMAFGPTIAPTCGLAQVSGQAAMPIKDRNMDQSRARAAQLPRSEGDQALSDGWPLYRTARGQTAFNDAMATLKATDGPPPSLAAFKGCAGLECNITLPAPGPDGWIAAGRIWVSPTQFVLIVHSPRLQGGQSYRRRNFESMRYFVYHEFHNSSRNIDPYDTISSHGGPVFVPLYMSKQGTDARGQQYVVVIQVAPYDVMSIHASNKGSSGPGIEVAKNVSDTLEPLQGLAGIVVGTIIKAAAPHLQLVNHRGNEGLPMLNAYERRLAALRARPGAPAVALPFTPAPAQRVATASGRLADLITRRGASPPVPIAERGFLPPPAAESPTWALGTPTPGLSVSPLAAYLTANLATMKREARFAAIIPPEVAAVAEEAPEDEVVYLLDETEQILGRIEAWRQRGVAIKSAYVYVPADQAAEDQKPFELIFPTLKEPIRLVTRP